MTGGGGLRRLAAQVKVSMDQDRRERQWAAVLGRLRPSRRRGRPVFAALGVATLTAAAAGIFVWTGAAPTVPAPTEVSVVEASAAPADEPLDGLPSTTVEGVPGGQPVTLADGSRARLAASARVRLPHARRDHVRVLLERGRVEFEVVPLPASRRRFVVHAGELEVRVTGTAFSVDRARGGDLERVTVSVSHGSVEVRRRGEATGWALAAGESFTSASLASPEEAAEAPAKPARAEPTQTSGAEASASPAQAQAPRVRPSRSARVIPTGGRPAAARPVVVLAKASPAVVRPVPALPAPPAQLLLAEAKRAREEGRISDAERALETIRTELRDDPRAPLAAFELGRLRLDRLGAAAPAATALRDALRLGPDAPFREDVEARLVEALARAGETAACGRARRAFLARYPHSPHAPLVRARCPSP